MRMYLKLQNFTICTSSVVNKRMTYNTLTKIHLALANISLLFYLLISFHCHCDHNDSSRFKLSCLMLLLFVLLKCKYVVTIKNMLKIVRVLLGKFYYCKLLILMSHFLKYILSNL